MPLALPVSSLLPPGGEDTEAHAAALPSPLAILGPLPPTAPLSLAAAFIIASDVPPFESTVTGMSDAARGAPGRVLVITGRRADWHAKLEDMDSEWLRTPSSEISDALKRIDIRYAPTLEHAKLVLSLLTSSPGVSTAHQVRPPSMIVLYDVASLLLATKTTREADEAAETEEDTNELSFSTKATISTYLDLISAALDAARHLGRESPLPLIILEPQLAGNTSLPILAPGEDAPVPAASRTARVSIKEGLERVLGQGSVGIASADTPSTFQLDISGSSYAFSKEPGTKSEFAAPPDQRQGGWLYTWT